MIDPNKGTSSEKLDLLRQESYERLCTQLKTAIEQKLTDYQMTWDDLADKLPWGCAVHSLKAYVGNEDMTINDLNDIAHAFSSEIYVIFRPQFPWVAT